MSVKPVREQVSRFLKNTAPEVISIRGKWGSGKTYTWNKLVLNARKNNNISLEKYSYVSLFGINSLDELKKEIFQNTVPKNLAGEKPSVETFKVNWTDTAKSIARKSLEYISTSSVLKNHSKMIEDWYFFFTKETIVCIDDLERIGNELDICDVLGIVNILKEQKSCKIVLLLNDEHEETQGYKKYREKVVDKEIYFDPTPKEAVDIAFEGEKPYIDQLKENCAALEINNIRILRKIKRLLDESLDCLETHHNAVLSQLSHSIPLFTNSLYSSEGTAPSLAELKSFNTLWMALPDEKRNERDVQIQKYLESYNFHNVDDLDLVLIEGVEKGYFNEEKLKEEANKVAEQHDHESKYKIFSNSWDKFHDSFDDNSEEVMDGLYSSFMANARYISPGNMSGTIRLFKELGEHKKASEMLDRYIEVRRDNPELLDLNKIDVFDDIKDPEIIDRLNSEFNKLKPKISFSEALNYLAKNRTMNSVYEEALAQGSVEDFYKVFKESKGLDLRKKLWSACQYKPIVNKTADQEKITKLSEAALKKIASESKLNEQRVKRYLNLEDTFGSGQ